MRTAAVVVSSTIVMAAGVGPALAQPAAPTVSAARSHSHVAGDIDGDGRSDFVVSVKHGFRVSLTTAKIHGSHVQHVTLPDSQNPSSFAVGDFNGDGYDDVAVGDPHSNYFAQDQTYDGGFFVYRGSRHGLVTTKPASFAGPKHSGDAFGQQLLALKLNKGKRMDLLEVPDQGGHAGEFVGTAAGLKRAPTQLLGAGAHLIQPLYGGGTLPVASGDVNGDGFRDLVVGLPTNGKSLGHGDNYVGSEGVIKVVYGTAHGFGTRTGAIHGRKAGTHYRDLGAAIAVGRVNGDKYDDIVAGAPGHGSGSVAVFYGAKHGPSASHDSVVHSGTTGVPQSLRGDEDLGASVTSADINGDGFADVVAGAPGLRQGAALVLYSAKHGITANGSQLLTLSDFANLPKQPKNLTADYGSTVTAFHPRGHRHASIAVLAPDYRGGPHNGMVGIYPGSKSGLKVAHPKPLLDVGATRNFSTGEAMAP